ncbi:uncharacterized protein C2845_PM04G04970 [Panicum miliaceum]|uniref:tRNA ligase phosphodiesterase domain-containing protein n=1 Tax=Panicum miliaceum TaxID=4540 RepID=A0A3L6QR13_PANMI|nr:uncharacterized protein C2845_PM04G04970 [Panicum miliaceum]
MPPRRDGTKPPPRKWKPKASDASFSSSSASAAAGIAEAVGKMTLAPQEPPRAGAAQLWVPRGYATSAAEGPGPGAASTSTSAAVTAEQGGAASQKLSSLFKSAPNFEVDNSTFTEAQIRATFYPKFENEKSDQETRTRMIEMVSHGLANLEVTLKHSGSLFMYAGHHGGAYAKNSFGNVYTAVGVFVLGRLFREAWGKEAPKMQAEFNDFLERNRISISMELVTAVLGDHGQRPKDDYAVVTAVTELGRGKPKFYSTPEVIAFCRKWRLPTNHVWLFSTRKSASSFFAAYDALCEEGTATPVCKALDEIADISVPGSKDHVKVQGEILEGLVARIVICESSVQMEEVLRNFPQPPLDGVDSDLGPSLREICAANRSDEKQQIKALLDNVGASMCPDHSDWFGNSGLDAQSRNADRSVVTKFLQAHPTDYATKKLQEMIRLMKQRHFSAAFKCYWNYQKIDSLSNDSLYYKMVIHVYNDSVFRRYQQEMRKNQGLWPLYRGFFVDVNLFKTTNKKAAELAKDGDALLKNISGALDSNSSAVDGLADEDSNLMVKLKFLTYKLRTFLIRNGLSTLFKDGPSAYRTYYLRQMKNWGTSPSKQKELSKMLDEWAVYIRRKYGNKPLSSSTYLSEAEPFLEQYAKRSPSNQALIGAAGNLVQTENFLAILDAERDEEGDLRVEHGAAPSSPVSTSVDVVPKTEGLIVFFPGIPGCAKSALCKEILNTPGGLGDNRPLHSLMGDLIKGKYWQKVADERKKKPARITLADKNAPNEEVWRQARIEDMCGSTKAVAVPVVPDSEGTDSNPFSLDALAVFMYRVLQRVNHPGNLDKASPNAGYVLLMFYHLYHGKSRREFENELYERFGSLVKMPLLKPVRAPLPDTVKTVLDEGISLFKLHQNRHGRAEPSKGSYAKEWAQWEQRLRVTLFGNADYLNSIQVPFESAVKEVLEQLKAVAKGDLKTPDTGKRKFGNIIFAAVRLTPADIVGLLRKVSEKDTAVNTFLNETKLVDSLTKAHVTLAHKRGHGVAAVASYGVYQHQEVPVSFNALYYTDKMAALEAQLGAVNGEQIKSRNEWPHATLWTAPGVTPKEANMLPQLASEGKATRVPIEPPITVSGVLDFY